MALHELKTWPEQFRAVIDGKKRHEFRKNDRDFRVGDTLGLREWDPETQRYTGSFWSYTVTWITHGGAFGIPEGYCVMSIAPVGREGTPP